LQILALLWYGAAFLPGGTAGMGMLSRFAMHVRVLVFLYFITTLKRLQLAILSYYRAPAGPLAALSAAYPEGEAGITTRERWEINVCGKIVTSTSTSAFFVFPKLFRHCRKPDNSFA
jgi:hypothetical protein